MHFIDSTEPTLVFLIGFASLEAINYALPDLLKDCVTINTSNSFHDLQISEKFIICPNKNELLHVGCNNTCNHLIECARTLKKQVYVIIDSIDCIIPSLRVVASHVIVCADLCKPIGYCGIWLENDKGTFRYF